MALLIGHGMNLEDVIAALQVWAARVDGVNAAERLNELTEGQASLPTVQTGVILGYAGATAPTGYLLCNGTAVSRTAYANLFAVIGTTYGAGDNVNTFNVPDLRGKYLMCKAASGTGSTIGGTFGTINHTHTGGTVSGSTGSESSHTHGVAAGTTGTNNIYELATAPSHNHNESGGGITGGANGTTYALASNGHVHTFDPPDTGAGSSHLHGAGTLAVGTSGTANPPTLVTQAIIKT